MTEDLILTAYHEAGHAVACWCLGLPFSVVHIFEDGSGYVDTTQDDESDPDSDSRFWYFYSQDYPREPVPKEAMNDAKSRSIMHLAGPEAERRLRTERGDLEQDDDLWFMFFVDYARHKPHYTEDVFKVLDDAWFLNRKTYRRKDPIENFPRYQPGLKRVETLWKFWKTLNSKNVKFLYDLEIESWALVDVWWPEVKVVADALLKKGTLTFDECAELLSLTSTIAA